MNTTLKLLIALRQETKDWQASLNGERNGFDDLCARVDAHLEDQIDEDDDAKKTTLHFIRHGDFWHLRGVWAREVAIICDVVLLESPNGDDLVGLPLLAFTRHTNQLQDAGYLSVGWLKEKLAETYEELVGYDPFEDDPSVDPFEVLGVILEHPDYTK